MLADVAGRPTAAATRRPRGSSTGSCGRSAAARRRRRDSSPRSSEAGIAAGAGAASARSLGAWLGVPGCCIPLASLLALHLRTQPWRKRTRHRLRKQCERQERWRSCAASSSSPSTSLGAAGKQRKSATAVGGSALTPKAGPPARSRPRRWPAPSSARRARRASWSRCSGAAAGRSSSGPWLSETGFELLYWIPFLAWAKAYGNFDPDAAGGGVARRRRARGTATSRRNYEDIFSFFTPDEFRVAQRAAHRRAGGPAEAHRDLVLRPRDPRRACEAQAAA